MQSSRHFKQTDELFIAMYIGDLFAFSQNFHMSDISAFEVFRWIVFGGIREINNQAKIWYQFDKQSWVQSTWQK